MPQTYQLDLPGGQQLAFDDSPGITFVIGPNAVGKSYAFRRGITKIPHLLYVPAGREAVRGILAHHRREEQARYATEWQPQEYISRLWSRALSVPTLMSLATSLLRRLGLPQQLTVSGETGRVNFRSVDVEKEYDVLNEASGVLALPTIGIAIFDPSWATVAIDEPEAALHPQAQAALIQVLRTVAARQHRHFVLLTHAPGIVDLRSKMDLERCVFIRRPDVLKAQRAVFRVAPGNTAHYEDLLPGLNSYKREAFFADRVLLVEGPTDRDLLTAVLTVSGYSGTFARAGILPADGATRIAKYFALLREIGVRPIALFDRDVVHRASGLRWSAGFMSGSTFRWFGWVTPDKTEAHVRGTPLGASVPLDDPASFEHLETLVADVRVKLARAEAVARGLSSLPASLARVASTTDSNVVDGVLLDASLLATDWAGTPTAAALSELRAAWTDLETFARSLDILLMQRGAVETYYAFAGKGDTLSKADRARAEIEDIYRQPPASVAAAYADQLQFLTSADFAASADVRMPIEGAAAFAGKVEELYILLFAGSPSAQLASLATSHRLEELSPGTKVLLDGTSESPPRVVLRVPMLAGFLNDAGDLELVQGVRPNVFETLR